MREGRFTGKQITVMVVAVCLAVVAAPVGVLAVTGTSVNISDPVTAANKARVSANGNLYETPRDPATGSGARVDSGALRVGGTVAVSNQRAVQPVVSAETTTLIWNASTSAFPSGATGGGATGLDFAPYRSVTLVAFCHDQSTGFGCTSGWSVDLLTQLPGNTLPVVMTTTQGTARGAFSTVEGPGARGGVSFANNTGHTVIFEYALYGRR
jgi:hypothetical protein